MTLDTQRKFQLVDDIVKYINQNFSYEDYNGNSHHDNTRIKIILGRFGIKYSKNYFDAEDLLLAEDSKINDLFEYLLNDKGLSHLFHDKYAIEVLANEERFFNLNLYLSECFECIRSDRKIATAMLLRCCVEILMNIFNNKNEPLAKKIDDFFANFEDNKELVMFSKNNKQDELKMFLEGVKDFGNDAAHLNGKNVKDFIEKYDNKEILKLFCILIEHSILKDDIRKRNEEDVENRVKSIDFTIKEKPDKINEQIVIANDNFIDDDIPF